MLLQDKLGRDILSRANLSVSVQIHFGVKNITFPLSFVFYLYVQGMFGPVYIYVNCTMYYVHCTLYIVREHCTVLYCGP